MKKKKAYSLIYILLVVTFITLCVVCIGTSFVGISYKQKISQVRNDISFVEDQIEEILAAAKQEGFNPQKSEQSVIVDTMDGYRAVVKSTTTTRGEISITYKDSGEIYFQENYKLTFVSNVPVFTPDPNGGAPWLSYYRYVTLSSSSGLNWSYTYGYAHWD